MHANYFALHSLVLKSQKDRQFLHDYTTHVWKKDITQWKKKISKRFGIFVKKYIFNILLFPCIYTWQFRGRYLYAELTDEFLCAENDQKDESKSFLLNHNPTVVLLLNMSNVSECVVY